MLRVVKRQGSLRTQASNQLMYDKPHRQTAVDAIRRQAFYKHRSTNELIPFAAYVCIHGLNKTQSSNLVIYSIVQ